jgi:hypothetical protein
MRENLLWIGLASLLLFFPAAAPAEAEAPHAIAGVELGGLVENNRDRFQPSTVLPVRYLETLKEVELKDTPGFKTGLVTYATCIEPERVVRIKMKYADPSKAFYDALLTRFKKRFGEPDEYRGDPFHIVVAWKWHFVDRDQNSVSLILQHNTRDDEEKEGNAVKMTMWNLIRQEDRCFQKTFQPPEREPDLFRYSEGMKIDWDRFVPR